MSVGPGSMLVGVVLVVLAVGFPVLAIAGTRRFTALERLSPIVLCYAFGILLGNVGLVAPGSSADDTAGLVTTVTVALAIPLLLFGTDFRAWIRNARPTIVSFVLAIVSIVVVAPVAASLFGGLTEQPADVAAMTVGVYTGGTANMAAIGQAVGVADDTFIALNAADIVASTVYLLFLLSPATVVLWRILPRTRRIGVVAGADVPDGVDPDEGASTDDFDPAPTPTQALGALGTALVVVLLGAGLGYLAVALLTDTEAVLDSDAFATAAVLGVTTGGIAASFVDRVRNAAGTYATGQYLFLVFAVAIGSRANLAQLVSDFATVFPYLATVLVVAILLHWALAAMFRIDRDTVLITSTAAVFGPPFVGPVASALGNREVVVAGMTTGVVGLAVGNYLGLAVANVLG